MVKQQLPNIKSATLVPESVERRRPGRREYTNPELIRLLRRDSLADDESSVPADSRDGDADDLRTIVGVMTAVIMSLPMWLAILLAVRYFIRL